MSVYPHRITPFAENFCDVCKDNKSTNFMCIGDNPYMGLQHCTNTVCIDTAKMWLTNSTINLGELKKIYGDSVIIQRSNGTKESGWELCSSAHKEAADGHFWVKITDNTKKKSKYISLETLQAINKNLPKIVY